MTTAQPTSVFFAFKNDLDSSSELVMYMVLLETLSSHRITKIPLSDKDHVFRVSSMSV